MKRTLLLILLTATVAGQAHATPYTLDKDIATQFRQVSVSPGDWGVLSLVIGRDGTVYWENPILSPGVYGGPMQEEVGFVGLLADTDHSGFASMRIGGPIAPSLYDGFDAYVANDNNSSWEYRLYVSDGSTVVTGSGWTALVPGTSAALQLSFPVMTLREAGFEVRADYALPNAPGGLDAFHVSVVPVPGALALVLFGLGFCARFRKYVRQSPCGTDHRVV